MPIHTRVVTRIIDTPLGRLTLGVTEAPALCLVEFAAPSRLSRAHADLERFVGPVETAARTTPGTPEARLLDETEQQLRAYLAGDRTAFDLPIHAPGTEFQQAVWRHLLRIPHGTTTTYGSIADALGRPGAQRAVGAANGANRIAMVIPCHRVIDASGHLHGYGGGLDRKRALLELEQANLFTGARP
ncbi:MAG: methylated-DNA--[protein]-cysteine S-methyltransferase [Phycisphaerales bacterium]